MNIIIKTCTLKNEIIDSFRIRNEVFVHEQKISLEDEFDLAEKEYDVFIVYLDNIPIATARGKLAMDSAKLERICVLKDYRNQNIGKDLVKYMITYYKTRNVKTIKLSSQLSALDFYRKIGFTEYGDIFLDANIKHRHMQLK